ncbi:hypothetical protein C7H85_02305 [Zobellella endophytica]|uniref:Uncharacterized protein n=1 Tax=Zobellella endophytica TaxID=2116700 RepID=A0A2P7RC00_9GAMM|nr:hypothetical protein [Zobellella endophytica]PSJ47682.1 hypothetical protein C7H85_02305 [Zobellella endophytica]
MKLHLWVLLWLPLAGCASQQERALMRLNEVAERVLAQECARPQLSYRAVENAHVSGLVDEVETLRCPGLEAQTYLSEAAANPRGMPIYLHVFAPHPALPGFMNIGAGAEGVIEVLGRPARQDARQLRYQSGETTDSVTFRLRGNRIGAIRWEWYFD